MAGLKDTMESLRAMDKGRIEGDEGIFKPPPDPRARRSLDFDNMDPDWVYERGKFKAPDTLIGKRIK